MSSISSVPASILIYPSSARTARISLSRSIVICYTPWYNIIMSKLYEQVCMLARLKFTPQSIASKLGVSLSTVYKHLRTARLKSYKKTTGTLLYGVEKYQEWRSAVLARDGSRCVNCKTAGTRYNPLQVDHIKPKSLYPELALVVANGRTLCLKCHKKTDSYGRNRIRKYSAKRRSI